MNNCTKCGAPLNDGASFCPKCGESVANSAPQQPVPPTAPQQPNAAPQQPNIPQQPVYAPYPQQPVYPDPKDHTSEFDPQDISDNKVTAMAPYIFGLLGIIIALLAGTNSKFASFHSRQALKIELVTYLIGFVTLALFWTFIIPIVGGICMLVLMVVRIICFFQVCSGKAKEAPIIGSLPFLK